MENNIIKIYENKKEVLESAKCEIFGALEPSELIGSVFTLTKLKMSLKKAENQFKEFSKPYQDAIKSAKEDLDELENDIKAKFLETYKESEVIVPKRQFNTQTGK
ncbi:hypothetical protein RM190_23335 [Paracoccus sp. CPCC 101403]|uniref:Uncharacterized protein n=1 Tax=Paracoccus broussonetiae TaxID=3075834 RepID=A0ABU3EKP8_9RHOB|nr:hypothetical protein [Paracoccus sp. CPCC 101403]MDT1064803.1 hypothetical protein [Paracoccus sp. CPCC 101403]